MSKRKLCVLLLSNSFFPRVDGSVLAVSHEMDMLRIKGHNAILITRKHEGTDPAENWRGFLVLRVGSDRYGITHRVMTVLRQALTGFRLCVNTKIDVIHAHGAVALFAGLLLSLVCQKPLVVTFHGLQRLWAKETTWKSEAELKITYPAIKFATKHADVLVAQSEKFREVVARLYRVDMKKIAVLPHVIDEEHFGFTPIPTSSQPTVLFVGALRRVYGADLFVRAASYTTNKLSDAQFLAVGRGPQKAKLSSLIRNLKLEKSVFLLGPVHDRKKLAEHYQAAKVVVIPQKYEGYFLSLVALEALASGRPIVTTQTLDSELYETAFSKAAFDPKDIADKIVKLLLMDEEAYANLAASARHYFETHCSKKVVASKLERLLLGLAT
ncbi:MAG: glycosyltransferase family 4 protein [Candidatus Bathyarchaeota archaeon]|nr:MAG: glycosyltransferase family 4 protein [Candidatus Bathyarchaeota archaeon]